MNSLANERIVLVRGRSKLDRTLERKVGIGATAGWTRNGIERVSGGAGWRIFLIV